MGAVDGSSRPLYLGFNKGKVEAYDPDTGERSLHKAWEAWITDISYEYDPARAKWGAEMRLHLHDGDRPGILRILMKSGNFRQFCSAIENADLTMPVTFRPWYKEDGERKMGGVTLWHGDERIPPRYTKEDPGAMPELIVKENPATKQKTYDDTDRMVYMKKVLDEIIHPEVRKIARDSAYVLPPPPPGSNMPKLATRAQEAPATKIEEAPAKERPATAFIPPPAGAADLPALDHETGPGEDDLPF